MINIFNFYKQPWLIITASFFFAITVQTMPWPDNLKIVKPSWVLLVLMYWLIVTPHRVNVGVAFLIGFLFDLVLGSTLGIRGLAFGLMAYVIVRNQQFIRSIALWQQLFVVTILCLAVEVLIYWLEFLISSVEYSPSLFWSVLINSVLWPWFFLLMERIRARFGIH